MAANPPVTGIARAQMPALIIGVLGTAVAALDFFLNAAEFYRAWLPAFIFWFLIAAGSIGVMCLQYVTGGEWGVLIRRPLGAASRTIPLFLVLGMEHIYVWANHDLVAHDLLLQQKQLWLNPTGWLIRALIFFAFWTLWVWRIRVLSLDFAKTRSPYTELSRRKWSATGLLV